MSRRLSVRCALIADESVPSWVSRLAHINGITPTREFCLDMGFTLFGCANGEAAALTKLHELTGTSLPSLRRASVITHRHEAILRGERLGPKTLRRSTLAVCPGCIADDIESETGKDLGSAYGRTLWRLAVVRSCPRHACAIVEIPHDRRIELHDFSGQIRRSLKTVLSHAETPEPRPLSALQTYVEDRLEGRAREPTWLDQLKIYVVVEFCETFGALLNLGPSIRYKDISEAQFHSAGHTGFEVAARSEEAFCDSLSRLQAHYPYKRKGGKGHYAPFRLLHRTMTLRQRDPAFEPVCAIFRQHIVKTIPVGPGQIVLGQPVKARMVHSINTAAQETGRHPKRLRKVLAAAGLIPPDHARLSDHYVIFPVERARRFLDAETNGLVLTAAAEYLNASAQQARMLAEQGFIKAYITHTGQDNMRLPGYAPKELDTFVSLLSVNAKPIDTPKSTMLSISIAAKRSKCDSAQIVRWILEKRLDWVGQHTSVPKYNGILVDVVEIKTLTYQLAGDYITIVKAASLLRKHRPVIDQLIAHGFLQASTWIAKSNNVRTQFIRRCDIEQFARDYICMTELREKLKLKPDEIRKRFETIKPATDRAFIDATYYRRSEISELL